MNETAPRKWFNQSQKSASLAQEQGTVDRYLTYRPPKRWRHQCGWSRAMPTTEKTDVAKPDTAVAVLTFCPTSSPKKY